MKQLLFLFLLSTSSAVYAETNVQATLDEAEDYLVVNPARTLNLLTPLVLSDDVPDALKLRRYILISRAAVLTNRLDELIQAVEATFRYTEDPFFQQSLTPISSGLGIWLRRNQYLAEARLSFQCAMQHAATDRQKLTLLNSLGLVARQLNDFDEATAIFEQLLVLAEQHQQPQLVAMAYNNLGLLAFDQAQFAAAEPLFRQSLKQYQKLNHRSGKISAGINLLFVFLMQNERINFERLFSPTQTLTTHFPNEAKQALLLWLELRFQQRQGNLLTEIQKKALVAAFAKLEDRKVQQHVLQYLAPLMGLNTADLIPISQPEKRFQRPWFEYIESCALFNATQAKEA
ncbi:tetratricopeptide repeat protein [Alishewanella sp. d11]|uniref:tetratricopeptide repeat protein n=1 Tax=Alishewanella sp. d11 TaxID=3414030 RepID=UPI003BF864D3